MSASPTQADSPIDADEQRLAELGYKQELRRKWSGFSNFAISFSIILDPRRLLHHVRPGLDERRAGRHLMGLADHLDLHPDHRLLHVGAGVGLPDRGGIYWWAAKMGKPIHGWFTGWLNLIGLIAVTASVDYGCATFLSLVLDAYTSWDSANLYLTFLLFVVIIVLHAAINIWATTSSTCCRTSRCGGTCSARPRWC